MLKIMKKNIPLNDFAPLFAADKYSRQDKQNLAPFFTNLTKPVYAPLIFSPEIVGALCSRTSRAADDLRKIFLEEYIRPFLEAQDDKQAKKYGEELAEYISFLHKHPIQKIFSNPRARSFYSKWLAQYGDDSIAQMAGMHVVYTGISQLAIKHFEDQRIGLAPIEKSTRYVDYSKKINGQYMYYTDPTFKQLKLEKEYRQAMDGLFNTYLDLLPRLKSYLQETFPEEKPSVVEKKAFDVLRGLLPASTLSQVAFFGNGQAFEYMISRSMRHSLGEIRWLSDETYREISTIAPSFVRRIKDETKQEVVEAYQDYLFGKTKRMAPFAKKYVSSKSKGIAYNGPSVQLIEHDPDGENKVIAGMLYNADTNKSSWEDTLSAVREMDDKEKRKIIATYLSGRTQRWQKVGRALENTYLRFEIVMNIGGWRDLHRHRILTQQRQLFTTAHGYDLPPEIRDAKLEKQYMKAIEQAEKIYKKIAKHDPVLAQYAVTLAHRVRFMQWKNVRQCFWEMELRTIPEGHPDYRTIEQEKFRLFQQVFPLLAEHMQVNLESYDFARRGQEERIQAKLKELEKLAQR